MNNKKTMSIKTIHTLTTNNFVLNIEEAIILLSAVTRKPFRDVGKVSEDNKKAQSSGNRAG